MAKRYERKQVKIEDLQVPSVPRCPWDRETAHRMFRESQVDGHRVLWFKCSQCSLEYQVRTWRSGENVEKHFCYCPECGSEGTSVCLKVDHELGPIFEALHSSPNEQGP